MSVKVRGGGIAVMNKVGEKSDLLLLSDVECILLHVAVLVCCEKGLISCDFDQGKLIV